MGSFVNLFLLGLLYTGQFLTSVMVSVDISDRWRHKPTHTTVLIAAALGEDVDPAGFGGKVDVRLFNRYGDAIGKGIYDKKITHGSVGHQYTYNQDKKHEGQQASYALVSGNKDDICIAYVFVRRPGETTKGWLGDWARHCNNAQWYYSNIEAGSNNDGPHFPHCIWIASGGKRATFQFQVYFPDFETEHKNMSTTVLAPVCNTPSYRTYPWGRDMKQAKNLPDKYTVHGDDLKSESGVSAHNPPTTRTRRRDMIGPESELESLSLSAAAAPFAPRKLKRHFPNDERIVMSSHARHSARDLCESETSYGPSLVSKNEGKFCDMRTKTVYALCRSAVDMPGNDKCFDEEQRVFRQREGRRGSVGKGWAWGGAFSRLFVRSPAPESFPHTTVLDWDRSK